MFATFAQFRRKKRQKTVKCRISMFSPITFSALFPSSWASVIVSFMSHISTTKTFNIPCARASSVIHLSTHTINPVTCIACSFNRTGLLLRLFHSTGNFSQLLQSRGLTFWSNFRRSSCDKHLITTWSRIYYSTAFASPNSQVWAFCLNLVTNCLTVSLASRKQSLSYGTFAYAYGLKYLFNVAVAFW